MRKLLTTTILLLVVVLAAPVWAQTNDVYWVHPYFASTVPTWVQVVNTGQTGTPISSDHGKLCADIYVFDRNQEMLECCSCPVTANGTLTLLAPTDLLGNILTQAPPTVGAYKIVSDAGANCNETNPIPTPDLRIWAFGPTYDPFLAAPLQAAEQQFLGQACAFVQYLGSGRGKCTCGTTVAP